MIYDIDGNALVASGGGDGLSGFTMLTEPTWEQGLCIAGNGTSSNFGNTVNGGANLKASGFIPVMGKNSLILPFPVLNTTDPDVSGFAFYDENQNVIKGTGVLTLFGRQAGQSKTFELEVFVPKNAAYFRTTYWSDSAMQADSQITPFTYTFTAGLFASSKDCITHETPSCRGMLNAIRRARQLTDVEWTPLVDIPRYCRVNEAYSSNGNTVHFLDWFKAGKTYKGAPYSGSGMPDVNNTTYDQNYLAGQWGYYKMWLCLEMELETFITAARYPNSILGSRVSQSQANFDSSPYGIVCDALVWYAMGNMRHSNNLTIYQMKDITAFKCDLISSNFASMDINNLQLCDLFYTGHHIAIVTDIVKDLSGNIIQVEVSEATTVGDGNNTLDDGQTNFGGIARRKMWTVSEVKSWFREYYVYRKKVFADITYTASNYVDTGNELDGRKIEDLPCIPYLGNKARYKVGYIPNTKILIGATGFTGMTVLKDGATFGTFNVTGLTEVSVGFSAVGSYSAYLTKSGVVNTMSCEWTVENP